MNNPGPWNSIRPALPAVLAPALAVLALQPVNAAEFDTGNPDLKVRLDATVRYNLGTRVEKENPEFANFAGTDETETRFGRGDIVTNRLDLIPEFDLVYRERHGLRLSAAGWVDGAYESSSHPNTAAFPAGNSGNYIGNRYNSYAKRYIKGPSGEFLDAFVFTGFDLGPVSVSVKAGQHNLYWGESLFSISNSIAYSQGPVDTIKAATSPGAEAKELFLPLKRISVQAQLAPTLSLAGEYLLDWKPFRLVPGGTYFADGTSADGGRSDFGAPAAQAGLNIPNGADITPDRRGNFGLNLRWSPAAANGTLGLYYRKFDERLPWSITQLGLTGVASPPVIPRAIRLVYARDTELLGLSYSTNIGSVSVGSELSYRKDTALVSAAGYPVLAATGDADYTSAEGARGNSLHALVNGVYLLPKTALWESGTLSAELSYVRLQSVTRNPVSAFNPGGMFLGGNHPACTSASPNPSCVSKDAWTLSVSATPEWGQVLPGWDLGLPLSLTYGLSGNSPTLGGSTEDTYRWSAGVNAKYRSKYEFSLKYADYATDYEARNGVFTGRGNGSPVQDGHGWLFFTFKTTF